MFDNGSEAVLVDFHMHTHKDREFIYTGAETSFVSDYVNAMCLKKISIGVITNHNKFDLGEFRALHKVAKKSGILILPGVELSIKEGSNGLHALIVFDPDEWLKDDANYIENFLNIVFRDTHNRENANTRCTTDVTKTLEELEKYSRDYFIVFAHIEQNNGLLTECDGGMIQSLAKTPLFRRRVIGMQKVRTRDKIPSLIDWLGYKPAFLDGSDSKRIEDIGKAGSTSRIKLGELSYAALKYALLDHENRLVSDSATIQHSCIRSIAFQGGKLDGCVIGLSPQLNTFIGIRGSGKSSVLEALRYGLQIEPSVDADYKKKLVKYVLDSGGKVIITIIDEHGKSYTVSRIYGENPTVLDQSGNDLAISVASIVRNPLYFGQKDLALTESGYEFELLQKLVGVRVSTQEDGIIEQVAAMVNRIRQLNNVIEIPDLIKELEGKLREFEHKLEIFKEKGISEKLEKQTSCNADGAKVEDIIKEATRIKQLFNFFLQQYDTSAISLLGHTSKYNAEIFIKVQALVSTIATHMAEITKLAESIDEDITSMSAVQRELTDAIDALKEEFAQIRREIQDDSLDIESFGKYQNEITRLSNEIARQQRELSKEKTIRDEIVACIRKRNDILLEIFKAYKEEIERINTSQSELQITITFKGNKTSFLEQLKEAFKGSGISEVKYSSICETFTDMVDIVSDVLMENGMRLRPLITTTQYDGVVSKVRENFEDLVEYSTPNLVEISYHGKPLNQHSMGQRASALVLFILSQSDNDVVIIDQPEDDLDNQVVYTEFIKKLKEKKQSTQFIFATHNANIPVLGDAERVVATEGIERTIRITSGTIDSKESHQQIVDIMEGGYEAFKRRNIIYCSWEEKAQ